LTVEKRVFVSMASFSLFAGLEFWGFEHFFVAVSFS